MTESALAARPDVVADAAERVASVGAPVRGLAELVSLASFVTPELVRSIRLDVLPHLHAGHEADLWWSPLVGSRGVTGFTFEAEVTRLLRRGARERWLAGDPAVAAASGIVRDLAPVQPALALEQEIVWLAVRDGEQGRAEIDAVLGRALHSFVVEGRQGLAGWWRAAWSRLPDEARAAPTAVQLSLLTAPALGPDAVTVGTVDAAVLDERVAAALRATSDALVGVRRTGSRLEVGDLDGAGGVSIRVPDSEPRYLELQRADAAAELLLLPRDDVLTRDVGPGTVRLRTARGAVYEIPPELRSAPRRRRPATRPPLGATYDGTGTTFALFSDVANRVELCLFDEAGREIRVDLMRTAGSVWAVELPGVEPGQRYGYRVHGPYDPANGLRCNPSKLLIDPYAKALTGPVVWDEAVFGYPFGDPNGLNTADSAPFVPKSVVVYDSFDWDFDRAPRVPFHETVIYEAHVRGSTIAHPEIPEALRGTYAGLAHPAVIEHFQRLGVTAVELMPVHEYADDHHLTEKGLSNYWGYNSIGFFAPHQGYAAGSAPGAPVQEFKAMVRDLHAAGIEVILDVDYAHTAEGNHLGPTLSLRGIDNAAYYRLVDEDRRRYTDFTGAGNSLNVRSPHTLQLIMDSLRYWVTEMHVDGFRFHSASTLAREFEDVDRLSSFFVAVQQDPVISQVKLIAEPWDVGPGGYQVGNFPPLWTEWNGKYRDTVRDFWRGEPGTIGDFATRLTGSPDLYGDDGRSYGSLNYVTSHEGFTLADLVSYDEKHNEANGEDNRDGESENRSWNCGVEGPTDDEAVLALRARQQRNFVTTLMLSQGVPMLLHGDEIGRTQRGNNNVYCQDNELSWVDWSLASRNADLRDFTAGVVALRRAHPVFRRTRFLGGRPIGRRGSALPDIAWFTAGGDEMTDQDWDSESARYLAVFLNGEGISEADSRGERTVDDSFLLCLNAHHEDVEATLPGPEYGSRWAVVVDTAVGEVLVLSGAPGAVVAEPRTVRGGTVLKVPARSVLVLQRVEPADQPQ